MRVRIKMTPKMAHQTLVHNKKYDLDLTTKIYKLYITEKIIKKSADHEFIERFWSTDVPDWRGLRSGIPRSRL